ncbi:MAG: YybS family protein [Desulfobacterales bacterium]|nr:YybS family protein [Desulfobacterales bacterium]
MPHIDQREMSKSIVNGIAITSFIFAISIYTPIFGFFSSLFIPLPIIFYRLKLGRKKGFIVAVAMMIIMIIMLGKISVDLLFFGELLILGFALGELIEMNLSIERTFLYACGTVLLIGIVGLFFYSNMAGTGISALISAYVAKNLEFSMTLYKNIGVSEENIHAVSNTLENIRYILVGILPALVTALIFFIAWINLLLAKPLLRSTSLLYPDFGSLKLWKAPEFLVWIVIGCGLLLLLQETTFRVIGLNGLIILMTIYFFEGIAIVSFYFEKKRFPRMLRFCLYSLIALQQVLLFVVVGLGFFDIWLNFRKLEIKNGN